MVVGDFPRAGKGLPVSEADLMPRPLTCLRSPSRSGAGRPESEQNVKVWVWGYGIRADGTGPQ